MNLHSVCANTPVLRIINHTQRNKWTFCASKKFLCNYKAHQRIEAITRIVCTDSNIQCYSCETQNESEKQPHLYYIHDNFLKENFKIIDSRYFKLITFPNECYTLEKMLWTNEFKEVLSRSPFVYDVNVAENSENYFCQVSAVHQNMSEDILCTYENILMNKQPSYEYKKVFFSNSNVKENERTGPSEEQLIHIIDRLTYSLINFFEKPQDYSIYHKNIVFQNNIKGVTIKGLNAYIQSMYFMKFYGYVHFIKVKVDILKITHHIEDGSIRVRWRVNGLPRHKLIFMLWKHKSVNWKEFPQEETEWLDGFSIFSVGEDGLIYKHVCDKMIPDDNCAVSKKVDLRSKVLGLLGLAPRGPAAGTLSTLIPCKSQEFISCRKLT